MEGRGALMCTFLDQVNRWLEGGWALAYVQYGGGVYLEAQRQAQAQRRGIWRRGPLRRGRPHPAGPAGVPGGIGRGRGWGGLRTLKGGTPGGREIICSRDGGSIRLLALHQNSRRRSWSVAAACPAMPCDLYLKVCR